MLNREQLLEEARQQCIEHGIAALFHAYGFNRTLHWNEEIRAYELRAKVPGSLSDGIHVTSLAKFIALPLEERKKLLQRIKDRK